MKTKLLLTALFIALGGALHAQDINIAEQESKDSVMTFDFKQDLNLMEMLEEFAPMMEKFAPMMSEMGQMFEGLTGDFETMLQSPELSESFSDMQESIQKLMDNMLKEIDVEGLKDKTEDIGNRLMQ